MNGEATEYLKFGPDQVVDAIRKAEMVFVDSFHGAVFSILFHKQFVVFNRSEKGQTMNSRLETLLKRFGLKNRIFNDNNVEELRQPIDYQYIDQIIEKEKVRVHDFLDSAMKEISVLPKEIEREKSIFKSVDPKNAVVVQRAVRSVQRNVLPCSRMEKDSYIR
ncbi:MAG: polysaccharide pyruvyl transferase family protein [[Ruminococcus] lactaris]